MLLNRKTSSCGQVCRARSDSGAPLKGSSEPSDTALPGSSPDSIVVEILSI